MWLRKTHKNTSNQTHLTREIRNTRKHTKTRAFWFSASLGAPRQPQATQVGPKRLKGHQSDPKVTPKGPQRRAHGKPEPSQRSQSDPKNIERETLGTPKNPKRPQGGPKSVQRRPVGDLGCSQWSKTVCRCRINAQTHKNAFSNLPS